MMKGSGTFTSDLLLKADFVFISVVFYTISLTQTAFYVDYQDGKFGALPCLLWGGLYLNASLSWLGNISLLFSFALLFLRNQIPGFLASCTTLVLMLSFLFEKTALVNESGYHAAITGFAPGCWLWAGSAAVILLGNLFFTIKIRRH